MNSSVRYDFHGAVTVVTGGSQGIGADVVRLMRLHGSQVVVWDLQTPLTEAQAFCAVDVTDRAAVEEALKLTLQRWGRIDHVVNCAGWAGKFGNQRHECVSGAMPENGTGWPKLGKKPDCFINREDVIVEENRYLSRYLLAVRRSRRGLDPQDAKGARSSTI